MDSQNNDDELSQSNQRQKEKHDYMRNKMAHLESMTINIAKDPAKAIMQISDPILQLIDAKTSHQESDLKSIQGERLRKQRRIEELRQQVHDQKFKQITLRRDTEEMETNHENFLEDTNFMFRQLEEQTDRKEQLQAQLEIVTQRFMDAL